MTFNPFFVIVTVLIITIIVLFVLGRSKKKKNDAEIEGVLLFGEKVTTQDYFSFCNTCIAYLLIDQTKTLDLAGFIQEEKLKSESGKESLRMIEQTINMFPIIACKRIKDAVFIVDETKTIEKIEIYQNLTKSDDYVIPLFDMGLITRNPNIFTVSTRYQQAKTIEKILKSKGVGDQFQATESIIKGLAKIAIGKHYEVPEIMYSDRNIQLN